MTQQPVPNRCWHCKKSLPPGKPRWCDRACYDAWTRNHPEESQLPQRLFPVKPTVQPTVAPSKPPSSAQSVPLQPTVPPSSTPSPTQTAPVTPSSAPSSPVTQRVSHREPLHLGLWVLGICSGLMWVTPAGYHVLWFGVMVLACILNVLAWLRRGNSR